MRVGRWRFRKPTFSRGWRWPIRGFGSSSKSRRPSCPRSALRRWSGTRSCRIEDLKAKVEDLAEVRVAEALQLSEKQERNQAMAAVQEDVLAQLVEGEEDFSDQQGDIKEILRGIEKKTMRERILSKGERADGRGWTRSDPSPARSASSPGPMARPSSPGARPRPWPSPLWAPPGTSRGSTPSTPARRSPSRSCFTTTSRPSPPARPSHTGVRTGGNRATAPWRSGPSSLCFRPTTISPTPSVWSRTSWSPTAPPPWPPFAGPPFP